MRTVLASDKHQPEAFRAGKSFKPGGAESALRAVACYTCAAVWTIEGFNFHIGQKTGQPLYYTKFISRNINIVETLLPVHAFEYTKQA
jgi:hypothetical protein